MFEYRNIKRFKLFNSYFKNETETASRWQQVTVFVTIIHSIDSFKWLIHLGTEASDSLYEWVIESLTH